MGSLLEKSLNFNSKIKINFEGRNLTSDAGLILYKEFDEKIGFTKTIKENLYIEDSSANGRFHKNEDIAIQRIYQKIGGYNTDDHADELRYTLFCIKIYLFFKISCILQQFYDTINLR
jgi:hypothetical protein